MPGPVRVTASDASVNFFGTSVSFANLAFDINDGQWHHLVLSFRRSTGQLTAYLDTVIVRSGVSIGAITGANFTFERYIF